MHTCMCNVVVGGDCNSACVILYAERLQSENSLLKGEVDSLTQQNKQQLQGLNQVQELATMLQESHR